MARGKFIAFCGGEGAGKSTHIKLLAEFLKERGIEAVITREPGGTPEGQHLRKLLLTQVNGSWAPLAETLMMVADRVQHIDRVIRPALDAGRIVISDRYAYSTLCYQGAGRGISMSLIRNLHREACGDLWPDLTVVLDLDPSVGLARSKKKLAELGSDEAHFEGQGIAFHNRVRQAFLDLAASGPARSIVVDAMQPVETIQTQVRQQLAEFLGFRGS